MKRVAILIGSPLANGSNSYLPGVKQDIENWQKFLMSASGGAYFGDEIFVCENPRGSKGLINEIQKVCRGVDIVLLCFSGHGYTTKRGNAYVLLNEDEEVSVNAFYTSSKRQITLVDACRTIYPYDHFVGIGGPGITFDNRDKSLARNLYDYYVANSPFGNVTFFSSSVDETSQDTEMGGAYTVSLFESISRWSFTNRSPILNVANAFDLSLNELSKSLYNSQHPELYYNTNHDLTLPFAINPTAYKNQILRQRMAGPSVF